jgi:hypothetical protein
MYFLLEYFKDIDVGLFLVLHILYGDLIAIMNIIDLGLILDFLNFETFLLIRIEQFL